MKSTPSSHFSLILLLLATSPSFAQSPGGITPDRLRCEYRVDPLGIDTPCPRLSWTLIADSSSRSQCQTAYQILVASSEALLDRDKPDLWNSGKVSSDETIQIEYAGRRLASRAKCYWKVRVWDREGTASAWSEAATWEMGLIDAADWKATWINDGKPVSASEADCFKEDPAPLFRKEFTVDKPVRKARLYVAGLGYGYPRLNGAAVGDNVLSTAWTNFAKRVLYDTHDVTDQIKQGRNCLGLMLGNGWYNPLPMKMWGRINLREYLTIGRPRGIAQLEIEFEDGTTRTVATDETWKTAPGPVLRNNIYLGEVYDARRELPGWDTPGFDDSAWSSAKTAAEPVGPLCARMHPPVRVTAELEPVRRTEPKPGVFIFDMGRNFAGWVTLRVRGPRGTKVKLRFGEILHPDGTLNVMTSVCGQIKKGTENLPDRPPQLAYQSDTYILSGNGEETYTPRFTWHGFRYVEITGYPGTPKLDDLRGLRLSADMEKTGTFSCSNEQFNRIQKITEWTFLSNLFDVQSDCPHRERFGYGGDLVASCEAFLLNFDMAAFYAKTVDDFADAARPCGGITELAPFNGIADKGFGDQTGPIGWQLAFPLLQEKVYRYYGDKRLIRRHYPATRRLIAFLRENAKGHLISHGISDHESVARKPETLTSTAFYYRHVTAAARLAEILGEKEDAAEYRRLAGQIRTAFLAKFFDPKTGRFHTGTQACQAFSLHYGLVPREHKSVAVDVLVNDILTKSEGHLSTGIFGTRYLMRSLSEAGRADVAHTIAHQTTWPGWGHMLSRGATTLWEHWAFSDNPYSHNHPAFGSVSAWFYEDVAGIRVDPEAVGCDRIIIRPQIAGGLTCAQATYESIRGRVESAWKLEAGRLHLNVRIPPGITATVYVPTDDPASVTESGKPAANAQGVESLGPRKGAAVFRVSSGGYRFEGKTAGL